MNKTITLYAGVGANLGPNFSLTASVGLVSPTGATLSELLLGKDVVVDDLATGITITSIGSCTTSLTLPTNPTTTTTTTIIGTTTTTTTLPIIVQNYGYLYNWYTGNDSRNLANTGWHVPTDNEFRDLRLYIEPGSPAQHNTVGGKLKEIGTTYWDSPNTGANNMYNFNGRANGQRSGSGFMNFGVWGAFWASDQYVPNQVSYAAVLFNTNAEFWGGNNGISPKTSGEAYRLKKDTQTDVPDGTIILNGYTGNDDQLYNTVVINKYEWTQLNLKESKYRNKDLIPLVQDSSWFSLSSGARCYYVI
jgi:uncharacterized protein (TIGR02145 family)